MATFRQIANGYPTKIPTEITLSLARTSNPNELHCVADSVMLRKLKEASNLLHRKFATLVDTTTGPAPHFSRVITTDTMDIDALKAFIKHISICMPAPNKKLDPKMAKLDVDSYSFAELCHLYNVVLEIDVKHDGLAQRHVRDKMTNTFSHKNGGTPTVDQLLLFHSLFAGHDAAWTDSVVRMAANHAHYSKEAAEWTATIEGHNNPTLLQAFKATLKIRQDKSDEIEYNKTVKQVKKQDNAVKAMEAQGAKVTFVKTEGRGWGKKKH